MRSPFTAASGCLQWVSGAGGAESDTPGQIMSETVDSAMLWGERPLDEGRTLLAALGPLRVWIRASGKELWLASRHVDKAPGATEEAEQKEEEAVDPAAEEWTRWVLPQAPRVLRIVPRLPDRPVIVKPEAAFRLALGARARVFVRVPLWLAVELPGVTDAPALEIPSVMLSRTWFGSFTAGELCYWISSGARVAIEPDRARDYLAICPVRIVNSSEEELAVEKICLRVAGMSLFGLDGQLWSDDISISWRGRDDVSRIVHTGKPPREAAGAQLLGPPRVALRRGLGGQTFSSLRDLSGFGVSAR